MKLNLRNFAGSRVGWGLGVSLFAVWFFFAAVVVTWGAVGVLGTFTGGEDFSNVAISLFFPSIIFAGSILASKLLFKAEGKIGKEKKVRSKLKCYLVNLGFKVPRKNVIWLTPILSILYVSLLVLAMSVLMALSPQIAGQEQEVSNVIQSILGWELILMVLAVGFLTPVAEEVFFRGLLIPMYAKKLKVWTSIIIPAALFGLAHGQVNVGLDTFIFGIILGYLTYRTASIYSAIFLHALKNCLALFVILS
jgi:membrane protease YdiL (CAAX protease family)